MSRSLVVGGAVVVSCVTLALAEIRSAEAEEPPAVAATSAPVPESPAAVPAPGGSAWDASRARGIEWLLKQQRSDGGWGAASHTSDVATTVIAARALLRDAGGTDKHEASIAEGLGYVIAAIDSAADGPYLDTPRNTQPQRKLGAYVDTHMAALLLGDVVEKIDEEPLRSRVKLAYAKVLRKVEQTQQVDGSFEATGWAPVLSSSMAVQSLLTAAQQGQSVDVEVLARNASYQAQMGSSVDFASAGGSAGVELYGLAATASASRTYESSVAMIAGVTGGGNPDMGDDLESNVATAKRTLRRDSSVVRGFGSMGGEEMLAYMMISDTLAQDGGEDWTQWDQKIGTHLASIQNADGSWSGHHCITSTVFVTAAALVTLGAGDHASG